ncbi:MAG: hypothetical protein E7624_07515 [Ruminococcaceae bacterium]|nr:hypothetical protein [Oscillospiraceae bacterium]
MSQLKCGAAERVVTPALGLNIPQCMSFNPATGVKDELYTHAIALEQGNKTVILISIDTSGLGTAFTRRVREALHREIGVDPRAVMVSAIHIHTGGPQLMDVYWGQGEDKAVEELFLRETVDAALAAYRSRVPVTARFAMGFEDRISFCRNYQMADGSIKTNPGHKHAAEVLCPVSEIDCTLSTLRFDGEDGKPVCEIVNFACHPDTVGGHEYSADFPGEMRRKLKDVYGNSHTVLFLNGCSGNVNHLDAFRFLDPAFRYPKDHYKYMGGILAKDVLQLHEALEPTEGEVIDFAHKRFRAPRRQPCATDMTWAEEALSDPARSKVDKRLAEELYRLQKHPKRFELVEMQVIRIGDVFVVGFPGEPYADIGMRLRDRMIPHQLILSELANNELGYFATEPAFSANVYEARLPSSPFEPHVLDRMIDTAEELIQKLLKNGKRQ